MVTIGSHGVFLPSCVSRFSPRSALVSSQGHWEVFDIRLFYQRAGNWLGRLLGGYWWLGRWLGPVR